MLTLGFEVNLGMMLPRYTTSAQEQETVLPRKADGHNDQGTIFILLRFS